MQETFNALVVVEHLLTQNRKQSHLNHIFMFPENSICDRTDQEGHNQHNEYGH